MPSLIYIARIRSLSGELAQNLRSAGCHVQSFKPGDITQDECLLAMTPEAADIALHPEGVGVETGRRYAGVPVPDPQLGSDTAILNCVKAAVANEINLNREPVLLTTSHVQKENVQNENVQNEHVQSPAADPTVPAPEGTPRAVLSSHGETSQPMARITPPPIAAPSSPKVASEAKNGRLALDQFYRILRNPLSTVVAVLVLAVVYRGLPAMTASPGRNAKQSTPVPAVSAETSHPLQRVQRHVSLDGFVAEDFTNHPGFHPSDAAAQQNLYLKRPQRDSTPKRIVVD